MELATIWNKWSILKFLWTANVLATALVVWRLYSIKLHRIYRFFFASIALAVVRSAVLYPFSPRGNTYYVIWSVTEPFIWVSYVLVVSELYSLTLRQYTGIRSVGRSFFFIAVAISVVLSALTIFTTMAAGRAIFPFFYFYSLMERGVATSLAIFLFLLLLMVPWFAVPLSRNLLTHCYVYSIYFFANNIVFLYRHLGGADAAYFSSVAKLCVGLICLWCWFFLLSEAGAKRVASLHLGRSPLQEQRLLGQLESLNATLLRTVRK